MTVSGFLGYTLLGWICGGATPAVWLEDPPKASERVFIGSIDVQPERREAVRQKLREQGFPGAFIPNGAAADTLLYRGSKQEYEGALELSRKMAQEEPETRPSTTVQQLKAVRRDGDLTDEQALAQLQLSPLQQELAAALVKETVARSKPFRERPPSSELMRKGQELNRWKRQSLRAILTRDQYARYFQLFGGKAPENELGPKPPAVRADAQENKSDDAIFARLALSDKQKQHLAKHRDWLRKATEEMKQQPDKGIEQGQKINEKWRSGLDYILTTEQRKQYQDYWGAPPERVLP